LVIRTDGIRIVRLRDIGEAREGVEEERSMARYNGRTCIFLGIVKQSKANTVEVANGIKAELELIRGILPLGVALDVAFDESVYVQQAIEEVWLTLAIAFGLVMVVIYLFLRDLRSTLIPMAAIPVSIVATFAILQWMGYSINILTMLALVLAIGVVVDDAIVVLENIYRHIEHGMRPMQAAFKAMDEISFAIIAITVSLVAVFLPLAFQTSTAGRLFVEFAVAVAGSVVVSAFVALSLSPMMAARILKPIDRTKKHNFVVRGFERLLTGVNHAYRGALGWSLSHRWVILLVGLGTLGLMLVFYRALDKDFLPEEDKGRLIAFVVAPEGATIEYTDRMMREMEGILRDTPEVLSYGCVLAPGFSGPGQANSGILFVRLQEGRRRSVQEVVNGPNGLRARLFREVEGAIANVQIPKAIGRGFSAPFQLVIQGQDLDVMDRYLRRSLGELRETGFLLNLRSSFEFNKPELRVEINRDRAAALGVSVEDISRTMQMLFGGLDLSRIKLDGKEYEVIAQLDRYSRLTPQDLDRLYVRNSRGELIQLSSLVTHTAGAAPNVIEHYNRLRSATITATPVGMPLGNVMDVVEPLIRAGLPDGFVSDWAGESRDLRDTTNEVWFVLVLALVIVYMVLAAQFESLVHPFTVMLAVPLAAVGALGLLWLMNVGGQAGFLPAVSSMNINLFSQIGLVLLVGLVTKNSILLVEFANHQRTQGASARDAMLEAGIIRLRPILMTAFSTIAGILPIAIGFGAGAESRRPMGMAVVGGLLTSTFLTLLVIPVVYTVLSDLGDYARRRKPVTAGAKPAEAVVET
jgi:multidrug efflux pump